MKIKTLFTWAFLGFFWLFFFSFPAIIFFITDWWWFAEVGFTTILVRS
jgi:uncharacterized membrane protein (UPF0182 family)